MKRRSFKAAVWLILAAALMAGCILLFDTADTASREDINPESLVVSEYAGSGEFGSLGWEILTILRQWQTDPESPAGEDFLAAEGIVYRAEGKNGVLTNAPSLTASDFKAETYRYIEEIPAGGGAGVVDTSIDGLSYQEPGSDYSLSFFIPEETVAAHQKQWEADQDYLWGRALMLGALALVALACVVALYWGAGRTTREDGLILLLPDRWFTEIYLLLVAGALAGSAAIALETLRLVIDYGTPGLSREGLMLLGGATALLLLLAVILSMPLVRKAKARTFLSGSACYWVLAWILRPVRGLFRGLRGFFDGSRYAEAPATRRIFRSQVAYICASAGLLLVCGFLALASYSFFFALVFIVLELLLTAWHVLGTRRALDDINAGLDLSRQAQVKSENIKTALITNVSHDLKTPLTSIISYVDLLSREEGLSDAARDYINVLAGKADRLNHMVSDLFDLSKSISGNIPLEMDVLDLRTLLEQTLADMKDKVDASGLTVKANLGTVPVPVYSDGKKLYRVFQNLIDNGLKYGLAGSRLYVELSTGERMAAVTVKNTAGYEMDFSPEEILQRFTRGDKARSGEGSGLGLSIAESFTQSCGGSFRVDIDGDQFKATITLPRHPEGGR